jgi:hypothetical protein
MGNYATVSEIGPQKGSQRLVFRGIGAICTIYGLMASSDCTQRNCIAAEHGREVDETAARCNREDRDAFAVSGTCTCTYGFACARCHVRRRAFQAHAVCAA